MFVPACAMHYAEWTADTWTNCGGSQFCPCGTSNCDSQWPSVYCKEWDYCQRQDPTWWRCEPRSSGKTDACGALQHMLQQIKHCFDTAGAEASCLLRGCTAPDQGTAVMTSQGGMLTSCLPAFCSVLEASVDMERLWRL